jgi:hypothetical protein
VNTAEALKLEQQVIESGKHWLTGDSSIDNQYELLVLAVHYNVKLPSCMHNFRYSNSPNEVCATGAFKTVYKTIDKLAEAIRRSLEVSGI